MTMDAKTALDADHRANFVGDYANAFRAGRSLAGGAANPTPSGPIQARRAELYGAIGEALLGRPYPERRAILEHLSPALEKEGIPRAAVAGFDPTDDAISRSIESARAVGLASQAGDR